MSTKKLHELIDMIAERHGEGMVRAARAEVEAIEKAAHGLNQLNPRKDWNQQAWDDALDLMETIAKERDS